MCSTCLSVWWWKTFIGAEQSKKKRKEPVVQQKEPRKLKNVDEVRYAFENYIYYVKCKNYFAFSFLKLL